MACSYNPKSKAAKDVELKSAISDYVTYQIGQNSKYNQKAFLDDMKAKGINFRNDEDAIDLYESIAKKAEKVVMPPKPKAVPVTRETSGLSKEDAFKQGFEEYIAAAKAKSREQLNTATQKLKNRINGLTQSIRDFKARQALASKYANDLLKTLGKAGIRYFPTAKVRSVINAIQSAKTEESLQKALDRLDSIVRKVAITEQERAIAAKRVKDLRQARNNARLGKFGDFGPAYAIVNIKEIPEELEEDFFDVISVLGQKGSFIIPAGLVNDFYERVSKFTPKEGEIRDTKKAEAKPEEDNTEYLAALTSAISSLNPNLVDNKYYTSLLRQLKKVPAKFFERYNRAFLKSLIASVGNADAGIMSGNSVRKVVSDYEGSLDAADIAESNLLFQVNKKLDELPKRVRKFVNSARGKSQQALKKELENIYASYYDMIAGSVKGSPIYKVFNNITAKKSAAEKQNKIVSTKLTDLLNKAVRSRIPKLLRPFKISSDPFFDLSVRMQLYFTQLEYESNLGEEGVKSVDDLIANIREDKTEFANVSGYSLETIEKILEIYDKHSVDGVLSLDSITESFNRQEMAVIDYMKDVIKQQEDKGRFIDLAYRNNPLPYYVNYFPRSGVGQDTGIDDIFKALSEAGLRGASFKPESSNERATQIDFIKFNPVASFLNYVSNSNFDFYLTPEVSRFNSTINELNKLAEEVRQNAEKLGIEDFDPRILSNALNKQMRDLLNESFFEAKRAANSGITGALGSKIISNVTKNILIKPWRLVSEFVFNYLPTVGLFSGRLLKTKKQRVQMNKENVLDKIQDMFGSVQISRVGSYTTDIKPQDISPDRRFSGLGSDIENAARRLITSNYLNEFTDFMNNSFYKITDSAAKPLWQATFLNEFKKLTKTDFDSKEFMKGDNNYADKYKRKIEQARAVADKTVNNIFNTGQRMETKLNQQKRKGIVSIIKDYMQSFAYNEQPAIRESLSKFIKGETPQQRLEGLTKFTLLTTRAIGYQVLNAYLYDFAINFLMSYLSDMDEDDEEEEKFSEELTKGFTSYALLAALGNKSAVAKSAIAVLVNTIYKYGVFPMLDKEREFDTYRDNLLFDPNIAQQGLGGFLGPIGTINKTLQQVGKSLERSFDKMQYAYENDELSDEWWDILVETRAAQYLLSLIGKLTGTPIGGLERPIIEAIKEED